MIIALLQHLSLCLATGNTHLQAILVILALEASFREQQITTIIKRTVTLATWLVAQLRICRMPQVELIRNPIYLDPIVGTETAVIVAEK